MSPIRINNEAMTRFSVSWTGVAVMPTDELLEIFNEAQR